MSVALEWLVLQDYNLRVHVVYLGIQLYVSVCLFICPYVCEMEMIDGNIWTYANYTIYFSPTNLEGLGAILCEN